jgi:hypothetical protein
MKDAYYFSHDCNARRDPKVQALRDKYGPEGYGVYFMLVEIMAEQHSYKIEKFPLMVGGLARDIGVSPERMNEILVFILEQCELFQQDDRYIWSESLMRRKEIQEQKRQARVEAGRIGGLLSGVSRSKTKQNEAMLEATNQSKVKESRVEERKEGRGTFVPPTIQEVTPYCQEQGVNPTKWMAHYQSNGWMVGRNKMKDWKAAVRTWAHSSFTPAPVEKPRGRYPNANEIRYDDPPRCHNDNPEIWEIDANGKQTRIK